MLKLVDIVKEYKVEQESIMALNHVSIEFRRNEFVSILGPSGCGKTTLLNIIGGLDRYTSGDIQIEGVSTKEYDDVDWDTYRNRRVGFVFQSYNLIPHMTILANVALNLTLAGVGRDERKERALEALKKVGLDSQAKKKPNQLSGGQMQRVAIARALVNNPEIILADEPTGALDSESGLQVMDLLKEVAKDRLVIMVTHNPQLADEYSTRIVYLKDGKVVGDTMPYDSAALDAEAESEDGAKEAVVSIAEGAEDQADIANETQAAQPAEEVVPDEEAIPAEEVGSVEEVQSAEAQDEEKSEQVISDEVKAAPEAQAAPKKSALERLKARIKKRRSMDRTAMKLTTAIALSWTNLISKKGRTLLTSIAGSIGIIGIVLVLALSNGAKAYITSLEESALSNYPISVNQSSLDMMSMMSTLFSAFRDDGTPKDDTIRVQEVMGQLIPKFLDSMGGPSSNDLHSFKQYVDANFDKEHVANVVYEYGTTMNCYILDKNNATKPADQQIYMKVNPYTEAMSDVIGEVVKEHPEIAGTTINIAGRDYTLETLLDGMTSMDMMSNVWSMMSDNQELLDSQYELVGKNSRWPSAANEIVIVVSENNKLMDYQLFMLGLQSQDEVMQALMPGNSFAQTHSYDVDDILSLRYKVMTNADYLEPVGGNEATATQWTMHDRTDQRIKYVDEHAVTFPDGTQDLKVVGVVRQKAGSVASSISGVIGYTTQLRDYLIAHALNKRAVQVMIGLYNEAVSLGVGEYQSPVEFYADPKGSATNGSYHIALGEKVDAVGDLNDSHYTILRLLGYADLEYPQAIRFYCLSFDAKDKVVKFIENYNKHVEEDKRIDYVDSLDQMMGFIDTMVTTITGVLVAFAAISLIVSTIMIAIIIYTSVLERRKEIGVLRSIGARKKDISRVFIAESAILGGYSGVIGVAVSALLSLLVSFILKTLFGIAGLVSVQWYHCILMLAVSVLLSMLAGFVPSRIAANKDPAIALRTE